ncbi:hypothetical protein ACVCAH_34175 [Micromonospora sp. LZ34]
MKQKIIRRATVAVALLVTVTVGGCGDDDQAGLSPAAAATTAASNPTAAVPSSTPSATASTSQQVDPYAPRPMGKSVTTADGGAVATVYAYRQPVARRAPRPDEQAGYVWGAADVKVCAGKTYPQGISVSHGPWTLVYADDTQIEASSTGYNQFPEPEYPWGEKLLAPGRCVRGWITFPVPSNKRPVAVEYAPEDEPVAPRWAVK